MKNFPTFPTCCFGEIFMFLSKVTIFNLLEMKISFHFEQNLLNEA